MFGCNRESNMTDLQSEFFFCQNSLHNTHGSKLCSLLSVRSFQLPGPTVFPSFMTSLKAKTPAIWRLPVTSFCNTQSWLRLITVTINLCRVKCYSSGDAEQKEHRGNTLLLLLFAFSRLHHGCESIWELCLLLRCEDVENNTSGLSAAHHINLADSTS